MGFIRNGAVTRADDEQIAFWNSRDTCPDCGAIVTPKDKTVDNHWRYICQLGEVDVEWTSEWLAS